MYFTLIVHKYKIYLTYVFSDMLGSSAPVNIPLTRHNSIGHFSPTIASPLKHMQNNMIQKSRYNQQDGLGHLNIVTGNSYGSSGLFGIGSPGTANTFPISPSNSNEVLKKHIIVLIIKIKIYLHFFFYK